MILEATTRTESSVTIVGLKGRLTLGNQLVSLENHLKSMIEKGANRLVLDLTELDYMDSAGIGVLMMCAGTARSTNGQVHIANPNDRIQKIFEIAHVNKAIPVYADVASAVAAFPVT